MGQGIEKKELARQFMTEVIPLLRQAAEEVRSKYSSATYVLTEEGPWPPRGRTLPGVRYQLVVLSPSRKHRVAPPSIGFRLNDCGQVEIHTGGIPHAAPVVVEVGQLRLKEVQMAFNRFMKVVLDCDAPGLNEWIPLDGEGSTFAPDPTRFEVGLLARALEHPRSSLAGWRR